MMIDKFFLFFSSILCQVNRDKATLEIICLTYWSRVNLVLSLANIPKTGTVTFVIIHISSIKLEF